MLFKQIQLFNLNGSIDISKISSALKQLKFRSCLPNLPMSIGWISPLEDFAEPFETIDELPLIHFENNYLLFCLQIEEKILPASVVKNKVKERIKEIEINENRKITYKEKLALRESIYHELLPQAFGRLSKVYAYIDTKNNLLVLNTTTPKKTDVFLSLFKKTMRNIDIISIETKNISNLITNWLQYNKYPKILTIENCCTLQGKNNQGKIIRCQQQDLFAPSIQALLNEGCEIKQMQFTWNDQLTFILNEDFTLRSLKYQDALLEIAKETTAEAKLERFNADFIIMTGTLEKLLVDLLKIFC